MRQHAPHHRQKNEEGRELIEVPLTLGAVGVILLLVWSAIGDMAALEEDCTNFVKKVEE